MQNKIIATRNHLLKQCGGFWDVGGINGTKILATAAFLMGEGGGRESIVISLLDGDATVTSFSNREGEGAFSRQEGGGREPAIISWLNRVVTPSSLSSMEDKIF